MSSSSAAAMSAVTAGPCAQMDLPLVSRLHRHALESIFAFLNLRELHGVVSVSHSWQSAVLSMGSIIDLHYRMLPLRTLLQSRLLRHVGRLHAIGVFTAQELCQLAEQAPQLRWLSCRIQPFTTEPIKFPAQLQWIALELAGRSEPLEGSQSTSVMTQTMLAALVPLAHLIHVALLGIESGVSLEPLQRMPALRSVGLDWAERHSLSDAQAAHVCGVPQLEELHLAELDLESTSSLERLLATSSAALSSLRFLAGEGDALNLFPAVAALLPRLPSLTEVTVCVPFVSLLESLRHLPHMRTLNLHLETDVTDAPRTLVQHVRSCRGLQELKISWNMMDDAPGFALNSALLGHCVAGLPVLHTLHLVSLHLGSLAFLAQGTVAHTLTDLSIVDVKPRLLPAEIIHVHGLPRLQSLFLQHVFAEPLTVAAVEQLRPPSVLLSALTSCDVSRAYRPAANANEADELGMMLLEGEGE